MIVQILVTANEQAPYFICTGCNFSTCTRLTVFCDFIQFIQHIKYLLGRVSARFISQRPLACIRAIRAAMPEGMPLFMRIDAQDDGFGEAGLTMEDTITFCNWAKDAGVDVLDVSRGNIVTAASKYEVQRDKPVRQGADPGR